MTAKEKAEKLYAQLTDEQKASIRKMNAFGRSQYVCRLFGNEDERFGISFGMFPLWVKLVVDKVMETAPAESGEVRGGAAL